MANESDDTTAGLDAAVRYVHELGFLKSVSRTGWLVAGVSDVESVAEHTFRTAIVGYMLGLLEGADAGRTAILCLFHDTAETRTGDIASVGRPYIETAPETRVVADQITGLPPIVAESIAALAEEYEDRETLEARLAKDADRIECIAQALEYAERGTPATEAFVDGLAETVESATGKAFVAALRSAGPSEWWLNFVSNYRSAKR